MAKVDPVTGSTSISHHDDNRVVVISGGSSGDWLSITQHFAALGATVIIFGCSVDVRDAPRHRHAGKGLALGWDGDAKGVRVNAVSPGPIAALKAFGDVSDVARAVAYPGSPDARDVTGGILDCDGGMRLGHFPSL